MNGRYGPINPFGKSLSEIIEEDLMKLSAIPEGWFFEYKKGEQNSKTIAKSISSFANSYGGLYFLGIEQNPDTNTAKGVCGVDSSPNIIHDSLRDNLQPFPHFISYPILLKNGRKVIMVEVPEGKYPPYIHSDGKIYRRQEAASDPISENNRHTIDLLYSKSRENMNRIENFRQIDCCFSASEKTPHIAIFINTVPFQTFKIDDLISGDRYKALLDFFNKSIEIEDEFEGQKMSLSGTFSYDTVNSIHNGIILRQMHGNNLGYNGVSIEIDVHGNAKIIVPTASALLNASENPKTDDHYIQVMQKYDLDSIDSMFFIDPKSFWTIIAMLNKYFNFLLSCDYKNEVEIKIKLINAWRTTIYSASKVFREHISQFGIPVCMRDEQYFPSKPFIINNKELATRKFLGPLMVVSSIMCALGIPINTAVSIITDYYRPK